MDPGIRQDFWAPAYRRGDAGFGDYGLLKFRCVYRVMSLETCLTTVGKILENTKWLKILTKTQALCFGKKQ